jgi:predicted enzyme related to lactoylglutathione lyase
MENTDMETSFAAGTVVYAKDLGPLSRFYSELVGLPVVQREPDFVVLESPACQLVLVAMPAGMAQNTVIATPPVRRENTAIKPCFGVPDLAIARETAVQLGGGLNGPEREWTFRGHKVCDGHDPEGNVFQLRSPAR